MFTVTLQGLILGGIAILGMLALVGVMIWNQHVIKKRAKEEAEADKQHYNYWRID